MDASDSDDPLDAIDKSQPPQTHDNDADSGDAHDPLDLLDTCLATHNFSVYNLVKVLVLVLVV